MLSRLFAKFLLCSLLLAIFAVSSQAARVVSSTIGSGTFKLLQTIPYSVTVEGTVTNGQEGPYTFIVYLQGTDIYGNNIFIEAARGTVPVLFGPQNSGTATTPATQFQIGPAFFQIPNDGTLHNTGSGYNLVVALYAASPTSLPALNSPVLRTSGDLVKIVVVPDLAIASPGATYPAGNYRGKDIIRFSTIWGNSTRGENPLQSRPLRPVTADRYFVNLHLTTDAQYFTGGTTTPDDFRLLRIGTTGDTPVLPDGSTQWRQVTVNGTPSAVPPYGVSDGAAALIAGTQRTYTPQPDDGYLDIGESVEFTTEQLIPENYMGRYFVASRVEMASETIDGNPSDADSNNTFVSNEKNKIEILETASPTTEPVSAVSTQSGGYVFGGAGASDFGTIDESGEFTAFSSVAGNLLIPPSLGQTFIDRYGVNADPANPLSYARGARDPLYLQILPYLTSTTSSRQIFLKTRQTGELQLVSRAPGGTPANRDCSNPAISADGRYIAYDSAADNLTAEVTGSRQMVYVTDAQTFVPVIVSRNSDGELANGACLNPSISSSGRFVAFESVATNLDPPRFTATISGGQVTGFTRVRAGAGYNPANPPAVTISGGGGAGATARAVVETGSVGFGSIREIQIVNRGGGYTTAPKVTVAPPPAPFQQTYLHDRDTDGNGIFDEAGKIATYLVSITGLGSMANQFCMSPAVNLNDTADDIAANGGMFVAFVSYARNMPQGTGNAMVYRTRIDVSNPTLANRGAVRTSVTPVSLNDAGETPSASGTDLVGAWIVPYAWEPAINGDGTQIAFTSAATNLVFNPLTGSFDADTNLVQDVFVRNLDATQGPPTTKRLSVSQERVATGTIVFASPSWSNSPMPGGTPAGNIPVNQPAVGDTLVISDGVTSNVFTFSLAPGPGNVPIGATVLETRNNLVAAINSSGLNILAAATTPPNVLPPGTAYNAGIYLKNTVPGIVGNVPIAVVSAAIVANGMSGGGTQSDDPADFIQGVPFGSNQPSIDRSGRYVAFRSNGFNLDVHTATDSNTYPTSPITGELIRPLLFPTSNVYVHDRRADDDKSRVYDLPGNYLLTRVSVSKFGYGTYIDGGQLSGINASTSANNSSPSISANGRFVAFSSDSEGQGGLIFGPNNLLPRDNSKFRDVFVHDRQTVGINPPVPNTKPSVTFLSPSDGLVLSPGTTLSINVQALAAAGKTIASVEVYVNNALIPQVPGNDEAPATSAPYTWNYIPQNPGTYVIRAKAIDSKGLFTEAVTTVQVKYAEPGAPIVIMTQPASPLLYVTGSKFFLNAQTTATAPATIRRDSVKFFVNDLETETAPLRYRNSYGVLYQPTVPGTVDTFRATAADSVGRIGNGGPLFSFFTLAQRQLPDAKMLPIASLPRISAGQTVTLQAEVFFPQNDQTGSIPSRVEFYVNNVYVGTSTNPIVVGKGTYSFDWEVPQIEVGDPLPKVYEVRARAVALNWRQQTGEADTQAVNNFEYYASIVTDPQTVQVFGVPVGQNPDTPGGFVSAIHEKLFYTNASYDTWRSLTDALASGSITRAQVISELMGYNSSSQLFSRSSAYSRTYGLAFQMFGRLPLLTPTTEDVQGFVQIMTNGTNATALVGPIAATYAGVPGSPFGATKGAADAMQRVIFDTFQFTSRYPGYSANLTDTNFITWMNTTMFPGRQDGGNDRAALAAMMASYTPQSSRRGAAAVFQNAFVGELLAGYNIDTGGEKLWQRQTASTALKFQLDGTWSISYGQSNPYSTNTVQGLLTAAARPVVTSGTNATAKVGTLFTNQITAINNPTYYNAVGLPDGVGVDTATGFISGTPLVTATPGFVRTTYNVAVSASSWAGTGTRTLTLRVDPPTPVITSLTRINGRVGVPLTYQITANNLPPTLPAPSVRFEAIGLPAGLTVNTNTGLITGTPTLVDTSTAEIRVISDGGTGVSALTFAISSSAIRSYLSSFGGTSMDMSPNADPDGDGHSNATEFAFGLNPTKRDVPLEIEVLDGGSAVRLTWDQRNDTNGISYSILGANELVGADWCRACEAAGKAVEPLNVPAKQPGYSRYTLVLPASTEGRRKFYRAEAIIDPSLIGP